MAYSNILKENTYACIDNVSVNKNFKSYNFNFYLYETSSKEKLLLEKSYNFTCKDNICKKIDKIYTSKSQLTKPMEEIYYYDSTDTINLPGFYNISFEDYFELDEKGKEIKKSRVRFEGIPLNFFIYNDEYFTTTNYKKILGIDTDYYFDNVISPAVNNNLIEVLYKTLEIIEPAYKDYPVI